MALAPAVAFPVVGMGLGVPPPGVLRRRWVGLASGAVTRLKRFTVRRGVPMSLILLIVVLVLLFGGGGGYYGYRRWGTGGGIGIVGLVLIILVVLYLFGGLSGLSVPR